MEKQIREFERERTLDLPLQCVSIQLKRPENTHEVLVRRVADLRNDILKIRPLADDSDVELRNVPIPRIIARYFLRVHKLPLVRFFSHECGNTKSSCSNGCGAFFFENNLFIHFNERLLNETIRASSRIPSERIIVSGLNGTQFKSSMEIFVSAIFMFIAAIETSLFEDLRKRSDEYTINEILFNGRDKMPITDLKITRIDRLNVMKGI